MLALKSGDTAIVGKDISDIAMLTKTYGGLYDIGPKKVTERYDDIGKF